VRATLKATMALLAAASFGGWVVFLGILLGAEANMRLVNIAMWSITAIYALLALAVGNIQGRRYGPAGIVIAVLASLLTWLILELFFHLFEISTPWMRAPLMAGIALTIIGAVVGLQRAADVSATEVDLVEEDTPAAAGAASAAAPAEGAPADAPPAADAATHESEGVETP